MLAQSRRRHLTRNMLGTPTRLSQEFSTGLRLACFVYTEPDSRPLGSLKSGQLASSGPRNPWTRTRYLGGGGGLEERRGLATAVCRVITRVPGRSQPLHAHWWVSRGTDKGGCLQRRGQGVAEPWRLTQHPRL